MMSMMIPGYAYFKVERPIPGAIIAGARIGGYGLMAAAVYRQWEDLRDAVEVAQLNAGQLQDLIINASLFAGGMLVNFVGWGADVLGAYHVAQSDKDRVLYKYGLQETLEGSMEERLIGYIRKGVTQDDGRLATDLGRTMGVYLTLYPFGAYASEVEHYLAVYTRKSGYPARAYLHAVRRLLAYEETPRVVDTRLLASSLIEENRRAWREDAALLESLLQEAEPDSPEAGYIRIVEAFGSCRTDAFLHIALSEAKRFLELYPDSDLAPRAVLAIGTTYDRLGHEKQATAALNTVVRGFPGTPEAVTAGQLLSAWDSE
jgi:tetratricopeptide (TPR) repeat protein